MNKIVAAIGLSGLLLSGCATTETKANQPTTEAEIRRDLEDGFRLRALERAAFDLRCEKDQLKIRALNAIPGVGAQMGVECGEQRMVYVFKQVGQVDAAWVAESASR